MVRFRKGQRKDDETRTRLKNFQQEEGVLYIGVAQEKFGAFRVTKKHNPETGASYPWLYRSTVMCNQYYFYLVDGDFGPLFIKFASCFPYTARINLNGHEYANNNTRDSAIGRLPKNLPALREIGFNANRRLLEVDKISQDCQLGNETFEQVNQPQIVDGQRASALGFGDERVMALFQISVLCVIYFGVTEKGCWIKDAKTDLDHNKRENQRSEKKRDVLNYRSEALPVHDNFVAVLQVTNRQLVASSD